MKEIPVNVSLPKLGIEPETRELIDKYIESSREPKKIRIELDDNVRQAVSDLTFSVGIVSISALVTKIVLALISAKCGGGGNTENV